MSVCGPQIMTRIIPSCLLAGRGNYGMFEIMGCNCQTPQHPYLTLCILGLGMPTHLPTPCMKKRQAHDGGSTQPNNNKGTYFLVL